jgi:hypothetical protein
VYEMVPVHPRRPDPLSSAPPIRTSPLYMPPSKPVQIIVVAVGAMLVALTSSTPAPARTLAGLSVTATSAPAPTAVASATKTALGAFSSVLSRLSDPRALEAGFHSYFAFKTQHPSEVKKPYLYFVDYGLPSTAKRGWVFDMSSLRLIDGPFTVAHGRGSSTTGGLMPHRFSNAIGSAATSLGLYVARALYDFHGKSGGHSYSSIGLRLDGVSTGFNDAALARGVVAHGAPYVTPAKAGRSEGCPAMELSRATRLLPKLADGGMVFLYAPDDHWMTNDPWVATN